MSKHSPAPWTFSAVSEQVIAADGETVVWESGTNEADNYLIAAAPELLEALKWVADRLHVHMVHSEDLVAHMRACEVISKATGETE